MRAWRSSLSEVCWNPSDEVKLSISTRIGSMHIWKLHTDYALYNMKRARQYRDLLVSEGIHDETMEYWNLGLYQTFHAVAHLADLAIEGPADVGHTVWALGKKICFKGEAFPTAFTDGSFIEGFVYSHGKHPHLVNALAPGCRAFTGQRRTVPAITESIEVVRFAETFVDLEALAGFHPILVSSRENMCRTCEQGR